MDRLPMLKEIFPNKSEETIVDIINLIIEEHGDEHEGILMEMIINLLSETGDSTVSNDSTYRDANSGDEDDDEGAVGYAYSLNPAAGEQDTWERLQDLLPNADPDYLREQAAILLNKPPSEMSIFVDNALEKKDYPTKEEYFKRVKEHKEVSKYTTKFNIDEYLQLIPNPSEKFSDPNRKLIFGGNNVDDNDINYAKIFLYNKYRLTRKKYIDIMFKPEVNLITVCKRLDRLSESMRKKRPLQKQGTTSNIELLQLIAYINNAKLIKDTIKTRDTVYQEAKRQAKEYGLLRECITCSDQLIPEECYFCMEGCVFCKDCLKTGTEVAIGNGKLEFPCHDCDSQFSLLTLKFVLSAKIYEKLEQRVHNEEIKKANLEGMDTCPFCDFVQILSENNKIFKCQNPECRRETCRLCRHESHVPLRCSEIEYDEDVRRRTFIENKMSESLMRTCYSCKRKFVKEHGCNKMTCTCKAKMCYICGTALGGDYTHFGPGKCELFTNNLSEFHLRIVRQGAQKAKRELAGEELKFDPEHNLEAFFL